MQRYTFLGELTSIHHTFLGELSHQHHTFLGELSHQHHTFLGELSQLFIRLNFTLGSYRLSNSHPYVHLRV